MRHFPVRSQAHGQRKVFEERKPRFSDDERGRGWHVQYDGLDEGHRFTRDPDTLEQYDPDAVRAQLQIEHRGVEALQLDATELRHTADRLSSQLESLGLALAAEQSARAAEVSALRSEADARAEEARRLAADVAGHLVARQEQDRLLQERIGESGTSTPGTRSGVASSSGSSSTIAIWSATARSWSAKGAPCWPASRTSSGSSRTSGSPGAGRSRRRCGRWGASGP